MDIDIIEDAIQELEESDTTADNVLELASLYIVRDNLKNANLSTINNELDDILPAYTDYISIKQKYQRHELTEDAVVYSIKQLCQEIKDLIHTVYSGTDMAKERKQLCSMLTSLYNDICH